MYMLLNNIAFQAFACYKVWNTKNFFFPRSKVPPDHFDDGRFIPLRHHTKALRAKSIKFGWISRKKSTSSDIWLDRIVSFLVSYLNHTRERIECRTFATNSTNEWAPNGVNRTGRSSQTDRIAPEIASCDGFDSVGLIRRFRIIIFTNCAVYRNCLLFLYHVIKI